MNDLYYEQCIWTGKYEDQHVVDALAWSKKKYNVKVYKLTPAEYKEIDSKVHFMVENYLSKTKKAGLPGNKFLKDLYSLKAKYEKDFGK